MLISIIVPTYNRAPLIRRCYESVLAQAHRPLEFLLVDDASTDETAKVAADLPPVSGVTVRYLRQPDNRGVSAARNVAIRAAKGKYLAFLDSDDVWFPLHLQKLMTALLTTEADIAYARGDIRESPDSPSSGRSSFGPTDYEAAHVGECLYFFNFVLPSVTVVKRDIFDRLALFDEHPQIQHAEDWDLFLRAAAAGMKFVHVSEPTGFYIQPDGGLPPSKKLMMLRRMVYCVDKHADYALTPLSLRQMTRCYYRLALCLLLEPEDAEAQALFRELRQMSPPFSGLAWAGRCGMVEPYLPEPVRPVCQQLLSFLFNRLRVEHRKARGLPDS